MSFDAISLTVRYPGSPRPALAQVGCRVPEGSLYAVVGPNGSGKSTLMRALLGTVPLESGSVTLEGRPLEGWSRRELARTVGVVSQSEPMPFPIRVRELVALGRYPHLGAFRREGGDDRRAILNALRECHVEEFARRDAGTLSGGELQRVRIARALAQEPRILVLDEPTASLDIRHEMEIFLLLRRWCRRGYTVVLISHKLDLVARFAHKILLLKDGRAVVQGPPTEVLNEEILEGVYQWPLHVTQGEEGLRIIPGGGDPDDA
ncbi:MAG: ABC transporter ATP-binding protein [Gemmatimonadota bacterium]